MGTAGERSLFHFCISRPVAISMVTIAICVFGLVGLSGMAVNLLPDVAYPTITVRTEFAGASPRDVEERVSERVQELVAVVPGIRRAWSVSRPGISDVVLEFGWGTTMTFAAADVRERLDRYFPPPGAGKPIVLRYDPSQDPVLTLALVPADASAPADGKAVPVPDLIELRRFADIELEERLAQIDGVAAVKLRGGDVEEVHIALDDQAMAAHGIDIATVTARLANENMNAAAGSIEEGRTEFLVRALNEYQSLEEIENTILESRGNARIRLREVAKVTRRPAEPQVIARIGGQPCVLVDVYKQADANIVAVCQQVRDRVLGTAAQQQFVAAGRHRQPLPAEVEDDRIRRQEALRARAAMTSYLGFEMQPRGIAPVLLVDQSRFVQAAVQEVADNAWQGGLLAVIVLYLFLRSGFTTMVLAISIPASLIATFAPLFVGGIDLNIMSLGGLALGVGMLLDNSIVVLESITKLRESGVDKTTAVVEGTRRMASAVFASTLTQIAVFFPIVFVEGLAGQLFKDLALTVVYAQLISIPVALFLVPMLASRGANMRDAPQPAAPAATTDRLPLRMFAATVRLGLGAGRAGAVVLRLVLNPLAAGFQRVYGVAERAYGPLLRLTLRNPLAVVLVIGAALALSVWRGRDLGQEILPEVHEGEFYLEAFLPRSATVLATDQVLQGVERQIRALPDVARTFLAAGVDPDELNDSEEGKHSARVQIVLRDHNDRVAQELRVRDAISRIVGTEPAILSHRFATASVLRFSADLVVEVIGHDLVALRRACDAVSAALQTVPGLGFVRSTLQRGNPELTIRLDRDQLVNHGLDAEATSRMLRTKVLGDVPTLYAERERKIDMRVRIDRDQLDSEERLRALNVNPAGYPEIPLSAVATIERREGPSEIRRLGNVRGAEVHAEVHGFDLGRTQLLVETALADVDLPGGVIARLGAQKEELERSNRSLWLALAMAVFLVYIVMAAQFESVVQPLIILLSVPLALIGVVLALDLLAIDVSVMVFLGCIVLAGIVVNNAIILIDQINQLRADGMPLEQAVLAGAQSRLRPVMMTMLTTLIGLLPQTGWLHALPFLGGTSDGVELRSPMAITVIAGLLSSTLLTLLLVPLAYRAVARERR